MDPGRSPLHVFAPAQNTAEATPVVSCPLLLLRWRLMLRRWLLLLPWLGAP